jgi:hypothetical protein
MLTTEGVCMREGCLSKGVMRVLLEVESEFIWLNSAVKSNESDRLSSYILEILWMFLKKSKFSSTIADAFSY